MIKFVVRKSVFGEKVNPSFFSPQMCRLVARHDLECLLSLMFSKQLGNLPVSFDFDSGYFELGVIDQPNTNDNLIKSNKSCKTLCSYVCFRGFMHVSIFVRYAVPLAFAN